MNILIVGSGAREHAIARALARSTKNPTLFCCGPSLNPGILPLVRHYQVLPITDCAKVLHAATAWRIDIAVIGPEAPLAQGLADLLWQHGIACIGPKQCLARIESSKIFARTLWSQHQHQHAPKYQSFHHLSGVRQWLQTLGNDRYVIKPEGLSGGKGVKVAGEHVHSFAEAYEYCASLLEQNQSFLIEERLFGKEFSLHCFSDGTTLAPLPVVMDFKRLGEGNTGPNTGSMGALSDSNHRLPFLSTRDVADALQINQTMLDLLQKDCGQPYIGILYGSFIATEKGIFLIEMNARFGDPEALNLLAILQTDFVTLCERMIDGTLSTSAVQCAPLATVCKYAVPEGYPHAPKAMVPVHYEGIAHPEHLYVAAVHYDNQQLYTSHSRTLAVLGVAETIAAAERIAEDELTQIVGSLIHRTDIGLPSSYE